MSFENRILDRIASNRERGIEADPAITRALAKKERLQEDLLLDPLDFAEKNGGHYSDQKVANDLAYVAARKREIDQRQTPRERVTKEVADVLEGIIADQIYHAEWLGGNADTLPVAEFDDLKNGVDILAEFTGDEGVSHVAMGIDVTFGSTTIGKKIGHITRKIRHGELGQMEYFESEEMGIQGKMTGIPNVVVGVEKETVIALAKHWTQDDRIAKKALAEHHTQFIILEQIRLQLEKFIDYARTKHQGVIANKMEKVLVRIQRSLDEKSDLKSRLFADERDYQKVLNTDAVYRSIAEEVRNI